MTAEDISGMSLPDIRTWIPGCAGCVYTRPNEARPKHQHVVALPISLITGKALAWASYHSHSRSKTGVGMTVH